MPRLTLEALESRCQKPAHRQVGNWMARRVARPLALRITWVIAPWGISAHGATLAAWLTALCAVVAFGWGTATSWIIGAMLMQLWYLLDHVDGQLARYHGTASLDGVLLDYLMHHTVNLLLPVGLGWGLANAAARTANFSAAELSNLGLRHVFLWPQVWQIAGLVAGVSLLLVGLRHDARYKAFIQRLKRVHGKLEAIGGGAARPAPQPPIPRSPLRLAAWLGKKYCEVHVMMNMVSLLAVLQWLGSDNHMVSGRAYLFVLALLAATVAVVSIGRGIKSGEAELEFRLWYQVSAGHQLEFQDGWWVVQNGESAGESEAAVIGEEQGPISS